MPQLAVLQSSIDSVWASAAVALNAHQSNFLANRGNYWGVVRTHSVIPSHTLSKLNSTVPDSLNIGSGGDYNNWIAIHPEWTATPLPCNVIVLAYNGPDGRGYEVVLQFIWEGNLYERHINIGPETYRNAPWALIPPN